MENVLSVFDYANRKMAEAAKSEMPKWSRSKRESRALRYALAYNKNETWLNSIEALFHRYGINDNQMELNQ